jgi:hypothetical protein
MPSDPTSIDPQQRDGTSQAGRVLPELEPDYAQVDGRTTRDLLAFARAYARELNYFGTSDSDTAQGDWSGFIGSGPPRTRGRTSRCSSRSSSFSAALGSN